MVDGYFAANPEIDLDSLVNTLPATETRVRTEYPRAVLGKLEGNFRFFQYSPSGISYWRQAQ